MFFKLFLSSIITFLILEISNPSYIKSAHKNNLINKFCIASIKSKFKFEDKQKLDEISHFTCECFFEKFNSGTSIKSSRNYCRNKATKKYNI